MRSFFVALTLTACSDRVADEPEEAEPCDFDAAVVDAADASTVDCGFVDLEDTLDAWQAAQSCALDSIANDTAMTVRWKPQVIDGLAEYAVVASNDGITWLSYDAYDQDEHIGSYACGQLTTQEDCAVAVGQMCFDCVTAGMSVDVCSR